MKKLYPELVGEFINLINYYWDLNIHEKENLKNKLIYKASENEKEYLRAIIDYISGMTDNYAINVYEEIISY